MNLLSPIHIIILFIITILPTALLILGVIFVIIVERRTHRRADKQLELAKQQTDLLQQKLQEINNRLITIEAMLKDVE